MQKHDHKKADKKDDSASINQENIKAENLSHESSHHHKEGNEKSNEAADLLRDELLRALAERENMRKRYEKQLHEVKDYAIYDFAKDLLTIMDNLERAITYSHTQENSNIAEKNAILEGLKLTMLELEKVFIKYNISKIQTTEGDDLDYKLHHAISSSSEHKLDKPGKVINIVEHGYKIKDRVLRPAMVVVSK